MANIINTRIQLPNTDYAMIDRRGKKHLNCQTEFAQLAKKALKQKKESSASVNGQVEEKIQKGDSK